MPAHPQSARTTIGTAAVTAFLAAAAGAGPDAKARFDALLADAWELDMRESPLLATMTGDHRFDDRLPSMTMADLERRTAASRARLVRLQAIERAALAPPDRVSYDVFERGLRDDLARDAFRSWRIPITSDSGFDTEIARLAEEVPLATVKDYENYISRLGAVPAYFDQHVAQRVRKTSFPGSFAEFLEFLRRDPRVYAKTPEELLKQASWIAKRMDGKLPSLFGRLPRQPYGVEPVPDDRAPRYTSGRYVEAASDSTRAGTFWVNTCALESRPLYALESLTLHEAVPGHHLQIALSRELEGLPAFRRYIYVTAFGEGWGLYAERLGLEAGFYTDPYSDFGRLTYEMWRACRLVVDTGIHAMGWTRQQAIDFMAERTALSLHEITTEVDRYISWPGQALAYKMGELKIRELRARAEKQLGTRFDVRAFHDAVLANGAVPLDVLDGQIDEFIAAHRN
jgi:uncharacterized protein (DUF885 family)